MRNKAECHPDRYVLARGLCNACYLSKWRAGQLSGYPTVKAVSQPTKFQKMRSYLKNQYHMEVSDLIILKDKQNNKCACCGLELSEDIQIDHDHDTGKVRGLLCRKCNLGIGMLGDSIEGVQKAVTYLGKRETDIEFHELGGIPPASKNVICIDFDGTLYPKGELFGYPQVFDGAPGFIQSLYDKGYYIVIWTSRLSEQWFKDEGWNYETAYQQQLSYIMGLLSRDKIPYHKITAEKIPALCYIDDRAIQFTNWSEHYIDAVKRGWL